MTPRISELLSPVAAPSTTSGLYGAQIGLHWFPDFVIRLLFIAIILTGPLVINYNGVKTTLGL